VDRLSEDCLWAHSSRLVVRAYIMSTGNLMVKIDSQLCFQLVRIYT
jgi:hypothetical protein